MKPPKKAARSFLTDTGQNQLWPADTDGLGVPHFVQALEVEGDYTAERLFEQRPVIYKLIVQLLALGWGTQKIADTVKKTGERLSKNTVKGVRNREAGTLDQVKSQLSARSFDLAEQSFEAAQLIVDEIMADPRRRSELTVKDAQSLAVVAGIAVQNGQLLTGQATARVEVHEIQKPDHDAFNEYLKNLPSANPTHLAGETPGQKGADGGEKAAAVAGDGAATVPGDLAGPVTDLQSDGGDHKTQ